MTEKKKKSKVTALKKEKKTVDVEDQMKKDEEEVDKLLSRYGQFQRISTKDIEEKETDEDEEIVSLNIKEDGTIQAVGEAKEIKREEVQTPSLKKELNDLILDRFIIKGLTDLIDDINKSQTDFEEKLEEDNLQFIGVGQQTIREYETKKREIRQALKGYHIDYEKIPTWAEGYLKSYIFNKLNLLIDFAEN